MNYIILDKKGNIILKFSSKKGISSIFSGEKFKICKDTSHINGKIVIDLINERMSEYEEGYEEGYDKGVLKDMKKDITKDIIVTI